LAERGIALQVTIGSFGGVFGKRAKRAAEQLIGLGAVHLAATDAHSAGHRLAAVPEGLRRLQELVGAENLQQLALHTPKALLNGGMLPSPITPPVKRSRNPMRKLFSAVER
jgi:protein-tyrosine phosphatase